MERPDQGNLSNNPPDEQTGNTRQDSHPQGPPSPPLLKRGSCALDELLGNTSGAAWQTPGPSESSQLVTAKRRKRKTNNTAASSPLPRKPIRLDRHSEYPRFVKRAAQCLCLPRTTFSAERVFSTDCSAGQLPTRAC